MLIYIFLLIVWTIKCNLHFHHTCSDWRRLKHLLPQLTRTAGIIRKASTAICDHLKNVKSFCYSYEIDQSWPKGKFQSGLLLDQTNSYFFDWRRYSLDIHCLVMLWDVEPQQLCHGDGQPHGVALLCLHYVRYRANQIL